MPRLLNPLRLSSSWVNGRSEFVFNFGTADTCGGEIVVLQGSGVSGVDLDAEKWLGTPAENPIGTVVAEFRGECWVAVSHNAAEAFGLDFQLPLAR